MHCREWMMWIAHAAPQNTCGVKDFLCGASELKVRLYLLNRSILRKMFCLSVKSQKYATKIKIDKKPTLVII